MARFVVCYDVANDRRRREIAACLDGYGDRIQESVFELAVDRALMEGCLAEISAIIDRSEDNIAIYRLCGSCERERSYLGVGATADRVGEEAVFIV